MIRSERNARKRSLPFSIQISSRTSSGGEDLGCFEGETAKDSFSDLHVEFRSREDYDSRHSFYGITLIRTCGKARFESSKLSPFP